MQANQVFEEQKGSWCESSTFVVCHSSIHNAPVRRLIQFAAIAIPLQTGSHLIHPKKRVTHCHSSENDHLKLTDLKVDSSTISLSLPARCLSDHIDDSDLISWYTEEGSQVTDDVLTKEIIDSHRRHSDGYYHYLLNYDVDYTRTCKSSVRKN